MAIKYIVNPFHEDGLAPINTSSGGGAITEVANYSALPAASTVTGQLYVALASQGTKWLPGTIGGTYYPKGVYYSDGTNWVYQETPYESTEAQVATGTNNDTFITPARLTYFKNSILGNAATKNIGTTAGTVAEGNDYRLGSQAAISGTDIDWNVATHFYKTLSANTTFTFSNLADAKTIQVAITNTASNYTVTWPTVQWPGGVAPTQTIGAKTDLYTFTRINGVVRGTYVQNYS